MELLNISEPTKFVSMTMILHLLIHRTRSIFKMRSRGTNVTDIAILVIAADDGFKPQTEEALKLAKAANNSSSLLIIKLMLRVLTLIGKARNARKRNRPQDWGGETVTVEVSALNGTNIDELLEMILRNSRF